MVKINILDNNKLYSETIANLNSVTVDTNGNLVDTRWYNKKSIFVNVSVNTSTVTVNIEVSPDGVTWFNLNSTVYTARTAKDIRSYTSHFPYMRTTTTNQNNATVTTVITGRN